MINLAIVGLGQIGSRHLQALSRLDRPSTIYAIDPSERSLDTARQRFEEAAGVKTLARVVYTTKIDSLPERLDVVVVATNADVRRMIVEELLATRIVQNLLLEKILFQSTVDIAAVGELLTRRGVACWVNCPMRMVPFYRALKRELADAKAKSIHFSVSGSQIGIGCNAIHYLDLLAFLSSDSSYTLDGSQLHPGVIPSKRKGFIEFTGTLRGQGSDGTDFSLTSFTDGRAPLVVSIVCDALHCVVREEERRCWVARRSQDWKWMDEPFEMAYQSQITQLAVQRMLDSGEVELPTYDESSLLHSALLEVFVNHTRGQNGNEVGRCRIT